MGKKTTPQKTVSIDKLRVFSLAQTGMSAPKIATLVGMSVSTVRRYNEELQEIVYNSPEWALATTQMVNAIGLSVEVVLKYLKGEGAQKGGDLTAAFKILEKFAILGSPAEAREKVEKHFVSIHNTNITINSKEDTEFAKTIETSLEQIPARLFKASSKAQNSS